MVYENQKEVENIVINREIFDQININPGGVIITSKGNYYDFVSRFFTPQATILEDPVTGSAHCTLAPYWSKILNKTVMKAQQISERKGIMSNNLNIVLRVDGGLVDSVFIPPNVEVIVRDYDIVSDCDPTLICEDEDGNRYVELVYMATGVEV